MPVELAAAIAAVEGVSSLVKASSELVARIGEGFFRRENGAKRELQEKLAELEESLDHGSDLARVAGAYLRVHEKVATLLHLCKRTDAVLRATVDDLEDDRSPAYDAAWRVMQTLFESIGDNRDVPRSVLLDRAEWYDVQDKAQIELRLNDFSFAYAAAADSVRSKLVRDARRDLETMVRSLEDVETLLRTTVYDKILRALEAL